MVWALVGRSAQRHAIRVAGADAGDPEHPGDRSDGNKLRLEERYGRWRCGKWPFPAAACVVAIALLLVPHLTGRFVAIGYSLIALLVRCWAAPQMRTHDPRRHRTAGAWPARGSCRAVADSRACVSCGRRPGHMAWSPCCIRCSSRSARCCSNISTATRRPACTASAWR